MRDASNVRKVALVDGYVPDVVYTRGAPVPHGDLIIPYVLAGHA